MFTMVYQKKTWSCLIFIQLYQKSPEIMYFWQFLKLRGLLCYSSMILWKKWYIHGMKLQEKIATMIIQVGSVKNIFAYFYCSISILNIFQLTKLMCLAWVFVVQIKQKAVIVFLALHNSKFIASWTLHRGGIYQFSVRWLQ